MDKEVEFEAFFKGYYSRYYYFALQMVDDAEMCRDLVGDAFEQAWVEMQQTGDINLPAFTYALVRNKCISYVRHEAVCDKYADFYQSIYAETDEESVREQEEQIEQMYRIMEHFTSQTQRILKLCYFQKMSYQQAADELGISVSTVRKHVVNALKAFRKEMIKKPGEG